MKIIIQSDEGKVLSCWAGIHTDSELPSREDLRVALENSKPERVANISSTVNPYQRRDLSLELVQRYLPSNYSSYEYVGPDGEEMIQIRGRDDAGWTLDGYVIPRLASADIYAREVE